MGSAATAFQLSVAVAAAVAGRFESCVMTTLLLLSSLGPWLSCCGQGAGFANTASSILLILPPLCVPINPHLEVQICGILQCPGALDIGTLLICGYFTGCGLKGKDKGSISLSCDVDITPDHIFKSTLLIPLFNWCSYAIYF